MKEMKKILALVAALCVLVLSLPLANAAEATASAPITVEYKDKDLDASYTADKTINLNDVFQTLEITEKGTYVLSGTLNGQIIVNVPKTDKVKLVLSGVTVTNESGPALYVMQADKVTLTLSGGTVNTLTDGANYTDTTDGAPNAALYAADDLVINGMGTLNVQGNYNHGIACKNDITIISGTISVNAVNEGIHGKDSVVIRDGNISIVSGGDGIQSKNDTEDGKGYIVVDGGNVTIDAQGDGIQAATVLQITSGTINITAAGGSTGASTSQSFDNFGNRGGFGGFGQSYGGSSASATADTVSAKGLKAEKTLYVSGGDITVNAVDDAIHTNENVYITGGSLTLSTDDDGIHADSMIEISGGTVNILTSYEGIEAADIEIKGGNVSLVASDDGLNASGGNDSSSMTGWGRNDMFAVDSSAMIRISGGIVHVNAGGDGVDSNGNMEMTGGEVYVSGPTDASNGALDYNGTFTVSGGVLVAAGATGMAQTTSTSSSQYALMVYANGAAGSTIEVKDAKGTVIVSFAPEKTFGCAVISSPLLVSGASYSVTVGGADVGTVTLTDKVTTVGSGSGGFGNGFGDSFGGHGGGRK